MKKYLALLLVLITILFAYLYYSNRPITQMSLDWLSHDVPTPIEGEKNSELVKMEPLYEIVMQDNINYFNGYKGFYVEPVGEKDFPGIIMIHEWWGLNDHIKDMSAKLAGQGYRVLAVDLFGTVATTSEEARTQVMNLDQQKALQNMLAAKNYLQNKGSTKIASLGWCFGGGQSLQISMNEDLDATVIYYGSLVTNTEELSSLKSPVLGIFGGEDTSIPVDRVNSFENSLNQLNIDNSITIYESVGHAFANPSGNNYSEEETLDAWNKTLKFLEEKLK